MICFLFVDDYDFFCDGFKCVLEEQYLMVVVGEVFDSCVFFDEVRCVKLDVVLFDFLMLGCGGFENIQEIKCFDLWIKVLILMVYLEDQYVVCCFKSGVDGYIIKGSSLEVLVNVIYCVVF